MPADIFHFQDYIILIIMLSLKSFRLLGYTMPLQPKTFLFLNQQRVKFCNVKITFDKFTEFNEFDEFNVSGLIRNSTILSYP